MNGIELNSISLFLVEMRNCGEYEYFIQSEVTNYSDFQPCW